MDLSNARIVELRVDRDGTPHVEPLDMAAERQLQLGSHAHRAQAGGSGSL